MLPAPHVLERIGLEARVRARRRAFEALASGLTDGNRQALDALLTNDPEIGRSRFTWLRDCPESPASSNMIELLDRLDTFGPSASMLIEQGASTQAVSSAWWRRAGL